MISPNDLRNFIIRPTLLRMGLYSDAAENLMIGTAAAESLLGKYLIQRNAGDDAALGIYQIEPATHLSIWEHYLAYRPVMAERVKQYITKASLEPPHVPDAELVSNLDYATIIARLVYWPKPEALPEADDLVGLGQYYKNHYNTSKGKGSADRFVRLYKACEC